MLTLVSFLKLRQDRVLTPFVVNRLRARKKKVRFSRFLKYILLLLRFSTVRKIYKKLNDKRWHKFGFWNQPCLPSRDCTGRGYKPLMYYKQQIHRVRCYYSESLDVVNTDRLIQKRVIPKRVLVGNTSSSESQTTVLLTTCSDIYHDIALHWTALTKIPNFEEYHLFKKQSRRLVNLDFINYDRIGLKSPDDLEDHLAGVDEYLMYKIHHEIIVNYQINLLFTGDLQFPYCVDLCTTFDDEFFDLCCE